MKVYDPKEDCIWFWNLAGIIISKFCSGVKNYTIWFTKIMAATSCNIYSSPYSRFSVQFSHSVVSDSLQLHGPQHTRPPCSSPCSSSLPEFTQTHVHWIGDAIQPSHPLSYPSSSCLQSFPVLGSFPMNQLVKGLEFQLQHQSFQWIVRTNFL